MKKKSRPLYHVHFTVIHTNSRHKEWGTVIMMDKWYSPKWTEVKEGCMRNPVGTHSSLIHSFGCSTHTQLETFELLPYCITTIHWHIIRISKTTANLTNTYNFSLLVYFMSKLALISHKHDLEKHCLSQLFMSLAIWDDTGEMHKMGYRDTYLDTLCIVILGIPVNWCSHIQGTINQNETLWIIYMFCYLVMH